MSKAGLMIPKGEIQRSRFYPIIISTRPSHRKIVIARINNGVRVVWRQFWPHYNLFLICGIKCGVPLGSPRSPRTDDHQSGVVISSQVVRVQVLGSQLMDSRRCWLYIANRLRAIFQYLQACLIIPSEVIWQEGK